MVTTIEYQNWVNHPVTQLLFKKLNDEKSEYANAFEIGGFLNDSLQHARAVGNLFIINYVLNGFRDEFVEREDAE